MALQSVNNSIYRRRCDWKARQHTCSAWTGAVSGPHLPLLCGAAAYGGKKSSSSFVPLFSRGLFASLESCSLFFLPAALCPRRPHPDFIIWHMKAETLREANGAGGTLTWMNNSSPTCRLVCWVSRHRPVTPGREAFRSLCFLLDAGIGVRGAPPRRRNTCFRRRPDG